MWCIKGFFGMYAQAEGDLGVNRLFSEVLFDPVAFVPFHIVSFLVRSPGSLLYAG